MQQRSRWQQGGPVAGTGASAAHLQRYLGEARTFPGRLRLRRVRRLVVPRPPRQMAGQISRSAAPNVANRSGRPSLSSPRLATAARRRSARRCVPADDGVLPRHSAPGRGSTRREIASMICRPRRKDLAPALPGTPRSFSRDGISLLRKAGARPRGSRSLSARDEGAERRSPPAVPGPLADRRKDRR